MVSLLWFRWILLFRCRFTACRIHPWCLVCSESPDHCGVPRSRERRTATRTQGLATMHLRRFVGDPWRRCNRCNVARQRWQIRRPRQSNPCMFLNLNDARETESLSLRQLKTPVFKRFIFMSLGCELSVEDPVFRIVLAHESCLFKTLAASRVDAKPDVAPPAQHFAPRKRVRVGVQRLKGGVFTVRT